jgi:uncharacterized membrane protein
VLEQIHLHPMIVHFPIALIIVGFASELIGAITKRDFFTRSALYLLILGALGVIAAYVSGNLAGDGVEETGALKTALDSHESAADLAIWVILILTGVRLLMALKGWLAGWRRWAAVALLAVGVAVISRVGYYGGELVFKHAAGVQLDLGLSFGSSMDSQTSTNDEQEND